MEGNEREGKRKCKESEREKSNGDDITVVFDSLRELVVLIVACMSLCFCTFLH